MESVFNDVRKSKKMALGTLVASATFALLCVSTPASAKTTRSCDATLTMSWLGSSNGPPFPNRVLDTFSATRGCGNWVPNRCRERARTSLKQCFDAAIAKPGVMPQLCQSNGVKGYDVGRLGTAMTRKLCEEPRWRNTRFDVRLTMRTSGNKYCPGTFIAPGFLTVSTQSCPQ